LAIIPRTTTGKRLRRTGGNDAGNRNYRHRHNRNNRRQNRNQQTPKASRFVGRETTLRDYIYDLQATQSDKFTKTTKEIATYVGRTFIKYTGALVTSVETLSLPMPVEPTEPDPTNPVQVNKHKELYSTFIKQTDASNDFKASPYSIVCGQCSDALQTQIESAS
jgi:flagellar hook assembly protein FlgD